MPRKRLFKLDIVRKQHGRQELKTCQNLTSKKYIETRLAELDNERIADQKEVLRYVTSVMRGESQSETIVVEGIGDGMSQAKRVIKHPDEKERLKAAEMLGKVHGMFNGSGGEENALDKLDKIIEGINNVANS